MSAFTSVQIAHFNAYVRVQKKGRWNMFDPRAQAATGLTREDYLFVMKNYGKLAAAVAGAAA